MTRAGMRAGLLSALALAGVGAAHAQQTINEAMTPSILLSRGYTLTTASSNGQSQFLYFQGADQSGAKRIFACQLTFGATGGFQGCLQLP